MGWFGKKKPPPSVKTDLGLFTFDRGCWMTDPREVMTYFISGQKLDTRIVDLARELLMQIEVYRERALQSARRYAREVLDEYGKPELEAMDLTDLLKNEFGMTFGFKSNSDFTLDIEFRDGWPVVWWCGD